MSNFLETFGQQIAATSVWEWLAVALAIAYLLLAIKENIWCWAAAFFSTAIYTVLFFDVNLFMESLLNIYYLLMAVYGFYLLESFFGFLSTFWTPGTNIKDLLHGHSHAHYAPDHGKDKSE